MNPPEPQPDSKPAAQYFDPEEFYMSEQQFSASLENREERPRFKVDEAEASLQNAGCPAVHEAVPQRADPALANECAEAAETTAPEPAASDWREQVAAKVNSYKSRRPRKERYPSLQLQFESVARQEKTVQRFERVDSVQEMETEDRAPRLRSPEMPVVMESTARVLEFPRKVSPESDDWARRTAERDELAEPVIDRPRIVEAPELLPPPPAMGGILIDAQREVEPQRRPGFDIPLQSASLGRRAGAGAVDALAVAAAIAAFGYIFVRITGAALTLRVGGELIFGLAAVLWPAYQYALLVFSGATPGLRLAGLRVRHFDGSSVSRRLRRWRVLASMLSAASLGLGYAWCFLDEDQLTWHDRITRTHLAPAVDSVTQ